MPKPVFYRIDFCERWGQSDPSFLLVLLLSIFSFMPRNRLRQLDPLKGRSSEHSERTLYGGGIPPSEKTWVCVKTPGLR